MINFTSKRPRAHESLTFFSLFDAIATSGRHERDVRRFSNFSRCLRKREQFFLSIACRRRQKKKPSKKKKNSTPFLLNKSLSFLSLSNKTKKQKTGARSSSRLDCHSCSVDIREGRVGGIVFFRLAPSKESSSRTTTTTTTSR